MIKGDCISLNTNLVNLRISESEMFCFLSSEILKYPFHILLFLSAGMLFSSPLLIKATGFIIFLKRTPHKMLWRGSTFSRHSFRGASFRFGFGKASYTTLSLAL